MLMEEGDELCQDFKIKWLFTFVIKFWFLRGTYLNPDLLFFLPASPFAVPGHHCNTDCGTSFCGGLSSPEQTEGKCQVESKGMGKAKANSLKENL